MCSALMNLKHGFPQIVMISIDDDDDDAGSTQHAITACNTNCLTIVEQQQSLIN
jgi:hypothetical protein